MGLTGARWPEELAVEEAGVVLRGPDPVDAQAITDAVLANQDHLRRFLPWAETPSTVDQQAVRLATAREAMLVGGDATYTVLDAADEATVVGAVGLHRRRGPGVVEIGYWLVADRQGQGTMTHIVRRVAALAFDEDEAVHTVQIRCHRDNHRSAGVPRRLGFALVSEDGDHLVWELRRDLPPTIG